jgi:ABC-type glycerol-3-phosphate transport system permease component
MEATTYKMNALGWIGLVLKYILLIVLAFTYILPFIWMATSALKDDVQVYSYPPVWFPVPTHWNNFWDAWTHQPFNSYAVNTVFKYAIPATLGTVLSSALVAYGFSRIRWRGREVLFAICLATMMVPFPVRMVPLFILFSRIDWVGTFMPLVVPSYFGNAFFIFMLRQFFRTIPLDLSDAARIDGVSELGLFWRIILPLSKPALAVVALFRLINAWNDYLGPLIYVNRREQWTLALAINHLRAASQYIGIKRLVYPYTMAVSTIVTMPILLAFFFAQRTFVEGITLTGIKG